MKKLLFLLPLYLFIQSHNAIAMQLDAFEDELKMQRKAFDDYMNTGYHNYDKLLAYIKRPDIDINEKSSRNNWTCLHCACWHGYEEVVRILLDRTDCDKNALDGNGGTALIVACEKEQKSIAELLLQQNVDVNATLKRHCESPVTALTLASVWGDPKIVSLILARNDLDLNDEHVNSGAMFKAARPNRPTALNLLWECGKVNKDIKDMLNKNFFYIFITSDIRPRKPLDLRFFSSFDEDQKKEFLLKQLFESVQVLSAGSAYCFKDKINAFVEICKQHGADLNTRNAEGKRPVDVAEDEYNQLKADLPDNNNYYYEKTIWKQQILHAFLRHTPCMSDGELFLRLKDRAELNDIVRVIFYYYYRLTIERDIALAMPTKPREYRNKCTEKALLELRNRLLREKLKLLGINY